MDHNKILEQVTSPKLNDGNFGDLLMRTEGKVAFPVMKVSTL